MLLLAMLLLAMLLVPCFGQRQTWPQIEARTSAATSITRQQNPQRKPEPFNTHWGGLYQRCLQTLTLRCPLVIEWGAREESGWPLGVVVIRRVRRRRTVGADAAPLDKEEAASTGPTSSTPAWGEEGERVRFDPWGSSSPGAPFPIDPRLSQTPRVSPGRRAPRPMPASYYWAQAQYHGTQAGTSYPQMAATPWFLPPASGTQPTGSSATFDRANGEGGI
ncbi:hypothetical protein EKO27_g2805 [Xylaria grammica]|uniref:Secreted protein n=1 Tax=Xylaria grammica TaxID=363999 RepID=A0A439DD21_9PEZI|nr:hypothetical protein EKO27_g2805 [Xylaria grammica]